MNQQLPAWVVEQNIHASPIQLADLAKLAQEQREAEIEVDAKKEALKLAEAKLKDIAEIRLPRLMDEIGIESFVTSLGLKITIKERLHASISEANAEKAHTWLESHGFGGIIKREFKIDFGKNQEDWANKFESELQERRLAYSRKKFVHHSTLPAWAKAQRQEGVDVPEDLFGIHVQRSAKISTE